MRIAYFDITSGISGDMTLGACIGAGVSFETLKTELKKLPLHGYDITMRMVQRSMITAVKIDVVEHAPGEQAHHVSVEPHSPADPKAGYVHDHDHDHGEMHELGHTHEHEHTHEPSHDHDHGHGHIHERGHIHENGHLPEHQHLYAHGQTYVHTHEHTHPGETEPAQRHKHTRSWLDIEQLIESSELSSSVKSRAKAMFLTLAEAEAQVHGTTVDKVHFHEVGAVDSIVDIVGIAICMELLDVERVYSSPVRTGGGGLITTQHGVMPVPAPATLEVLKGYPMEFTQQRGELATPTGAAVIAALSSGVLDPRRTLTVSAIGYGAGGREIPGLPNVLRLMIGEIQEGEVEEYVDAERIVILETTIDDMNPELYPWVIERLLAEGALDAWVQSVLMKKGRPGHIVTALAPEHSVEALLALLYAETTTTGVRMQTVQRRKLHRGVETVQTRFGLVSVKVIGAGGSQRRVPEFEECRRLAQELNLPLLHVYRCVEQDCGVQ